jgi:hypothetical protein
MFTFLKGVVSGIVLGFVVSALIGHAGYTGGMLNVRRFEVKEYDLYWSWALFVVGSGLGWGIFALMD